MNSRSHSFCRSLKLKNTCHVKGDLLRLRNQTSCQMVLTASVIAWKEISKMFSYRFKDTVLELSEAVVSHFSQHRQFGDRTEAGGELFATYPVNREKVRIDFASGPHPLDQRQKSSIHFNKVSQDEERLLRSKVGLVPVGLWHTHDECMPRLSPIDKKTGRIYANNVAAVSPVYFMIIVSNQYELDLSCWVLSRGLFRRMFRETED